MAGQIVLQITPTLCAILSIVKGSRCKVIGFSHSGLGLSPSNFSSASCYSTEESLACYFLESGVMVPSKVFLSSEIAV